MADGIKKRVDLLLALLFAGEDLDKEWQASSSVVGITRLEKILFILKMDGGFLADDTQSQGFHFVPFRMGPWTNEVYDEVDFLESLGLLSKKGREERSLADAAHDEELISEMILDKYERRSAPADEKVQVFALTEEGKRKAAELWRGLSDQEKTRLINIKRRYNNMNLKQFLRYVYTKYPEYTSASEILEDLNQ